MLRSIELTGTKNLKTCSFFHGCICVDGRYVQGKIIGGKCGRDTPGNMPNPEVKPASVDGTVRGTHGRADRCQFKLKDEEEVQFWASSFFVFTFHDIILAILKLQELTL